MVMLIEKRAECNREYVRYIDKKGGYSEGEFGETVYWRDKECAHMSEVEKAGIDREREKRKGDWENLERGGERGEWECYVRAVTW
jgi:hypothetical protein